VQFVKVVPQSGAQADLDTIRFASDTLDARLSGASE